MDETTPPGPPGAGEADGLRHLVDTVGSPDDLRRLLDADGIDDGVIGRFVDEIGVEAVLDRLFGLMSTRFVPAEAGGAHGAVQWNIDGPGGQRTYRLLIADGRADSGRGAPERAKVTLTMSLPNLLRLCAGQLDGVTGVLTGKIKISGDMKFGAKLQGMFDYS